MFNFKNYGFLPFMLIATLLFSCETDTENNANNNNKIMVSTMTLYTGNDINNLEKVESYTFKYNNDGNILSKVKSVYEKNTLVGSSYFDYTYTGNTVIEINAIDFGGTKTLVDRTYIKVNSNKLIESDSSFDLTSSSSPALVKRRIYNSNQKVNYIFQRDTTDGFVYDWVNGNLTKEYLFNGLMGRFNIMSYTYGNKANTVNTGDFWNDGMKSANLPESALEPNYEYKYTYTIESDGFISEELISVSSPGGSPYRYEKRVYTR